MAYLQNSVLQIPRGIAVHLSSTAPAGHGHPSSNTRDGDGQHRAAFYSSKTAKENSSRPSQPLLPYNLARPSAGTRPSDSTQRHSSSDRKSGDPSRAYKIIQNSLHPDAYIYESSVASQSDIFSSSASSHSDTESTVLSMTAAEPERLNLSSTATSLLRITNPGGETSSARSSSPPSSPRPFSVAIPPLTVALQRPGSSRGEQGSGQPAPPQTHTAYFAKVETVSDSEDERDSSSNPPRLPAPRAVEVNVTSPPGVVLHDRVVSKVPDAPTSAVGSAASGMSVRDREGLDRNMITASSRRQSYISPPGIEAMCSNRTVRFTENLVCPSPILPSMRRKGWYNRRG